jgi:hypothetical protein
MSVSMTRLPARGGVEKIVPVHQADRRCDRLRSRVEDDDVLQIGTARNGLVQRREALGRGHEGREHCSRAECIQLFRLEQRIERNEGAASRHRAEAGGHGLDPLVEVDGDALERRKPELQQTRRESAGLRGQVRVVQRFATVGQRACARRAGRGDDVDELVQQCGFVHGRKVGALDDAGRPSPDGVVDVTRCSAVRAARAMRAPASIPWSSPAGSGS